MKGYKTPPVPASEITPPQLFYNRRKFMKLAGGASFAAIIPQALLAGGKLGSAKESAFSVSEELTPLKNITHYNNFYEFGTSKEDPAMNAGSLKTRPWTIT